MVSDWNSYCNGFIITIDNGGNSFNLNSWVCFCNSKVCIQVILDCEWVVVCIAWIVCHYIISVCFKIFYSEYDFSIFKFFSIDFTAIYGNGYFSSNVVFIQGHGDGFIFAVSDVDCSNVLICIFHISLAYLECILTCIVLIIYITIIGGNDNIVLPSFQSIYFKYCFTINYSLIAIVNAVYCNAYISCQVEFVANSVINSDINDLSVSVSAAFSIHSYSCRSFGYSEVRTCLYAVAICSEYCFSCVISYRESCISVGYGTLIYDINSGN